MQGVIVEFQYGDDFDRTRLEGIAREHRGRFEGLPGLRQKAFTLDEQNRRATNVYFWETEEAARHASHSLALIWSSSFLPRRAHAIVLRGVQRVAYAGSECSENGDAGRSLEEGPGFGRGARGSLLRAPRRLQRCRGDSGTASPDFSECRTKRRR